ncbi:MAG: dihydropteroate synthase [Candidatus Thorarchaeota archaeon]
MNNDGIRIKGIGVGGSHPVRIMGVVNLSPESFYKGSVTSERCSIKAYVQELIQSGADILDVGGASSAPKSVYGMADIGIDKEIERLRTALKIIVEITDVPISIDTTSSKVAKVAWDYGIDIINDISGFKADTGLAAVVADWDIPVILMANCPTPCNSVVDSINSLKNSMSISKEQGVAAGNIILDPGFGFGKPPSIDFSILQNLKQFKLLGKPLLVGVSRKAFIGACLDEPDPSNRLTGTIAATSIAVANGADIIRAHDVDEARTASKIGEAVRDSIQDS